MHVAVAAVEVATKAASHDVCNDATSGENVDPVQASNTGNDAINPDMNLVISDILSKPMDNKESDILGFLI